ncbi:MAG: hypothetical protein P1U46_01285 [Patescibacteria group bacterium]|nr:hypothetical protein [Patescibacteria group bacterium]
MFFFVIILEFSIVRESIISSIQLFILFFISFGILLSSNSIKYFFSKSNSKKSLPLTFFISLDISLFIKDKTQIMKFVPYQ